MDSKKHKSDLNLPVLIRDRAIVPEIIDVEAERIFPVSKEMISAGFSELMSMDLYSSDLDDQLVDLYLAMRKLEES